MKHLLIILSILLLFSLTIFSCSEDKEESTTDTTAPVIAEVTAVTTPTNDSTPDYTFSSTEPEDPVPATVVTTPVEITI